MRSLALALTVLTLVSTPLCWHKNRSPVGCRPASPCQSSGKSWSSRFQRTISYDSEDEMEERLAKSGVQGIRSRRRSRPQCWCLSVPLARQTEETVRQKDKQAHQHRNPPVGSFGLALVEIGGVSWGSCCLVRFGESRPPLP